MWKVVVPRGGIEPPTRGLSVRYSNPPSLDGGCLVCFEKDVKGADAALVQSSCLLNILI